MSFAYMPLFTGDYLRDTRGLSPLRHGVYLLALIYCWDSKGPMPLDEQECAGICNCRSGDEVEALRFVLGRYFVRMEDGWYQARMQREVEKSQNLSSARSAAGKRGYEARAKQLPSKSLAIAEQVHLSPSPSPSPSSSPDQTSTPVARSPRNPREALRAIGSGEKLIDIPCIGQEVAVHASMVTEWADTYPSVDVPQTLKEIRAWCIANPTRLKTPGGCHKFINSWLAREQNRG